MGGVYGWLAGWVALCAYLAANTTVAYLGAAWLLAVARRGADTGADRRGGRAAGRRLLGDRGARRRRPAAGHPRRDRRRDRGVDRDRPRAAAGLPRARAVAADPHARRARARRHVGRGGAARRAGGRRLGVHRVRRVRRRRGGDAPSGAPRAAGDLDRAAGRRGAGDPQRGRRRARASRPGGGRRRRRRRPGHDRGDRVVRDVGDAAVRRRGARRVPGLRRGVAGADRAHDLLGRARRRPARLAAARVASTAARCRSARRW